MCATTSVRNSLMTLTTLEPPVVGFVTVWTQQSYGDAGDARRSPAWNPRARRRRRVPGHRIGAAAAAGDGCRGSAPTGLANVALLRRPADLDEATWRQRWHIDHTPVAIETQSTFGYTQNAVVRAADARAPR